MKACYSLKKVVKDGFRKFIEEKSSGLSVLRIGRRSGGGKPKNIGDGHSNSEFVGTMPRKGSIINPPPPPPCL